MSLIPSRIRAVALRIAAVCSCHGTTGQNRKLDAQTICAFGQTMDLPAMEPRSEALLQMTELLRARTCLKTELTALKLHASTHRSTPSKAYLEACIHPIETSLRALETEIRQCVATIACLRKLLVRLNCMMRNNELWRD